MKWPSLGATGEVLEDLTWYSDINEFHLQYIDGVPLKFIKEMNAQRLVLQHSFLEGGRALVDSSILSLSSSRSCLKVLSLDLSLDCPVTQILLLAPSLEELEIRLLRGYTE